MNKKEKVIILKAIKYGESDLIIHALNRQGARLAFFARGGAKSRKRFGGGTLEPTHYVEVTYKERPDLHSERLHSLLEASLIQGFENLRTDWDRLQTALYFLRVTHKLSQEGAVDSNDMFDLLGNALNAANRPDADVSLLKLHFEIKVLGYQGVLPALPIAEAWLRQPLAAHSQFQMESTELRQLESDVHHSLEAYLAGQF